ncbi:MAG: response regulator transcription factor [Terriglobales bacterium]
MNEVQCQFSRRERQIVYAVLQAKAVKDIAHELDLSVNTVKDYLKTIYRKAEVHSARELMRKCQADRVMPPDTGLAQLLQHVQQLKEQASPSEALAQLHGAVRACTRARRVTFWRWLRTGSELYLVGELSSSRPGAVLRVGDFGRRLRERGWGRLEVHEMGSADGRELSLQGLSGEVIGLECSPAPRVQVMLAGDPAGEHFGPLDAAVMRLLVRLTHCSSETRLYALSATA